MKLEIKNLNKSYGKKEVLKDIKIHIQIDVFQATIQKQSCLLNNNKQFQIPYRTQETIDQ